jgi:phage-related protein
MPKWKIKYYTKSSGKIPVKDFINNLPETSQAKVHDTFELLIEFNLKLGRPYIKKLKGTPLWELRLIGKKSIRFFYFTKKNKIFLFLHAFIKKSQKTPKKEIKIALQRLKNSLD